VQPTNFVLASVNKLPGPEQIYTSFPIYQYGYGPVARPGLLMFVDAIELFANGWEATVWLQE
jgi:hypothetical protein